MTGSFRDFLGFPEQDRRDVFAAAAQRIGTLLTHVEKDFWVSLVLDMLFGGLPAKHPALFFKGGTSLSKAFGLIHRLSEDVDLVVDRRALGFSGNRDPFLNTKLSRKKRRALIDELRRTNIAYIGGELRTALTSLTADRAPGSAVDLDEADPETLLVTYPTLFPAAPTAYVSSRVKIEAGTRSATKPNVTCTVVPLIARELGAPALRTGDITVIAAERTYWEKLLILHGWSCGFRDDRQRLPADRHRVARHYYDVAMLTDSELGGAALTRLDILDSVRNHNLMAFPQAWKRFDQAVPGTLRFVPHGELRRAIERDYRAMASMIYGDVPSFGWAMDQLHSAEERANDM